MAEETKIGIKLEEEAKPIKKMCEKLMDAVNHELDKGIENIDTKELGEAIDMIKDLYEAKKEMYEACYYKGVLEAMEEHDFEGEEDIMDDGRRGYRGQPRSESGRFMSRGDGRRSNRGRGGRRGYEEPMDYDMMPEWYRDMDRDMGKMYYSGGGSSGGSSSGSQGGNMGGGSSSGMSGGSNGSSGGSRGYSEGEGGQYASRMQRDGMGESRYDRAKRGYEETKAMHKSGSAEDKQITMKEAEKMINVIFDEIDEMLEDAPQELKSMIKTKGMAKMQKIN